MQNVVLDACVLYPAPIRDLLLNIAALGLFKPFWSETINNEWVRNLLINRPDLSREKLGLTVNAMNNAFPDANIREDFKLISQLELPDQNDCHVLATGIKSESEYIITWNLKDFPHKHLIPFKIQAISPDDFIAKIISGNESLALAAFNKQVARLKNPTRSPMEVLETLKHLGLIQSSAYLIHLITYNSNPQFR